MLKIKIVAKFSVAIWNKCVSLQQGIFPNTIPNTIIIGLSICITLHNSTLIATKIKPLKRYSCNEYLLHSSKN